jgi:Carboxypeptidase regulatory-like domain
MYRFRSLVWACTLLLTATYAFAQTSSLNGRVADLRGGVVANAEVSLRPLPPPGAAMPNMPNMRQNEPPPRTTTTGADGAFAFQQLPAGTYVLQVDAPGFGRAGQEVTIPTNQTVAVTLEPLEIVGAEAAPRVGGGTTDTQALLERIKALEQRINELESLAVLSEPETRVKRIEVFVDDNGVEYDQPAQGTKKEVTYQRERVYRRQTINEKLEEAIADAESHRVGLGVNATIVSQTAIQNSGPTTDANGHTYALASADLFFNAGLAQHTVFFADVVALSGSVPDQEIPSLTLLNAYTARLGTQNQLNLRETWLRTELFSQRLAIIAGRLDLTNYFDHNTAANDETTQFLSDALVNNPALGLAVNGTGVAAVYDSKNGISAKVGLQQSNNDATNLSDSIFTLTEFDYVARPFRLPEGNYRVWYRWDNSLESNQTGFGLSIDQKFSPATTIFGRYGQSEAADGHDRFYSLGVSFKTGIIFNPQDAWGIGYAQTELASGENERLVEGYYNLHLTERLRLAFHLQHVLDNQTERFGYFLPGVRLQASF